MALIGSTNKITTDIYTKLLNNDKISKLLYYNTDLDTDIADLDDIKNPIGKLKGKVFMNRRLEKLQREADIGMTISLYSKSAWKRQGKTYDDTLENIIEIGICCHEECDNTINGSRTFALIDIILSELKDMDIYGLGKIYFVNMYKTKDLPIEYNGYLMYFSIFDVREDLNVRR